MKNNGLTNNESMNDRLIDAIGMIDEKMVRDAKMSKKRRSIKPMWEMPVKRAVIFAAAIVLCIIISVPALAAAEAGPVQELLYSVAPSIAQRLKPIRKSCVDNGIQMEVVSANILGDTAEIYIAMKDLEGDRIDGTIDLFDSYDIRDSYDCTGTCSLESYDEKTGVATFLILIQQMDGKKIDKDQVTFSVSEFMSHKKEFEGMIFDVEYTMFEAALSSSQKMSEIKEDVNIRGGSIEESARKIFLKPRVSALSVPIKGAEVSAIGYIDGKLHVQMYYEDILHTDNHGWLWLEDGDGNRVECAGSESFWDDEEIGSYEEYVFDIPHEELGGYGLYGELIVCDTLTEGNWQVTFLVDDMQEK